MSDIVEDPSDSLRHEIERIIYGDIKSRDPAIDREIGQILALVERYQELQHEELVQEIVKTDTEARINELRRLYPSFTVDGHFSIDGEKIVERLATLYSRRKS